MQHIGHAFDRHILQISVQKILFFHNYKRKTVCRIHLRRCEHNSAHTVVCTDIDLYGFRHQHPGMYDIPVSMYRRIKFQSGWKRYRKIRPANCCDCTLRIYFSADSFQHNPSSLQIFKIFSVSVRYSSAISLSG